MSTISLQKSQGISLTKDRPGLSKIKMGLGWDVRKTDGKEFYLDATAFLLGEDGKAYEPQAIVGFMQEKYASVSYGGDNRTGEGEGDDETINVTLSELPDAVKKIAFAVTIYEAEERKQNFGGVENCYARIVNEDTGEELCRFDLREDFDIETAMIMGELYRHDNGWKFRAIGQGFNDGLQGLVDAFGLSL